MNKVNRLLLVFLFTMTLIFVGLWQLLQTEKFASLVSGRLQQEIAKQLNVDISFNNINISVFPPATIFRGVKIKKESKDSSQKIEMNLGSVGVYFGIVDLLSSRLLINKVKLNDGTINIQDKRVGSKQVLLQQVLNQPSKKTTQKKKDSIAELYQLLQQNIVSDIPLKLQKIDVSQVDVTLNGREFWIEKFNLGIYRAIFQLEIALEDLDEKILGRQVDSIELDLNISRDKIWFKKFIARKHLDKISFQGELFDSSKVLSVNAKVKYFGEISTLIDLFPVDDADLKRMRGLVDAEIKVTDSLMDPDAQFDVNVMHLNSEWVILEKVSLKGHKKNALFGLDKLIIKDGKSSLTMKKPIKFYDMVKEKFVENSAELNAVNLHTNTAIHVAGPDLDVFKGLMHGDLTLSWDTNGLFFSGHPGFQLKKFSLDFGDDEPILINPLFDFAKANFFVSWDGIVTMDLDFIFGEESRIETKGVVGEEDVHFDIKSTGFDFEKFGPIAGVGLAGNGNLKSEIKGKYEDVSLYFYPELDDFSVVDLFFGTIKSDVRLDLKDVTLHISNFRGGFNRTKYTGEGSLGFDEKQYIDLNLNFQEATIDDSRVMYRSLIEASELNFPEDLAGTYSARYRVLSEFRPNDIQVSGTIDARNIFWNKDNIDFATADFKYLNSRIDFKRIKMGKRAGRLIGDFSYDANNGYLFLQGKLSKLKLSDLLWYKESGLGYDGVLYADFLGEGIGKDFSSQSKLRVMNSRIGEIPVAGSSIRVYNNSTDLFVDGAFMGGMVKLNSFINLDKKKKKRMSYFDADIDIKNMRLLAGIISAHNMKNETIAGTMKAGLKSTFSVHDWKDLNLFFEVEDFDFYKEGLSLRIDSEKNLVSVVDGKIKEWDIILEGGQNIMEMVGSGSFKDKLKVQNNFKLDASILSLITDKLQKITGRMSGRALVIGEQGDFSSFIVSEGENVKFKVKDLSGNIEEVSYKINVENKELRIDELKGKYGKGDVSFKGNILFKFPFPEVDIQTNIVQSKVPILKRSQLVVSGDGRLHGKTIPYIFESDLSVLHGEIRDEVQDFFDAAKEVETYNRFVPIGSIKDQVNYLDFNLGINLFHPLLLKNSLAEMKIEGGCRVVGSLLRPLLVGEFGIMPQSSKFVFKGHEFFLREGNVVFHELDRKINPRLKFVGVSRINEYDVQLDVSGVADKLMVKLNSEPSLPQEDILSLLTLGVTSDISKNLGAEDRQYVTSVGLGSLLVDQLNLNQGLTSALGLKLSVMPEFDEDESSLLQGRTGGAEGATTRLRSTTKIKVKKKVHEKVDLTLSSTVGGSLGQKQEMNVDYNFHKNFSLEGVYEKQSAGGETTEASDSVGADLKFRWSFK